MSLKPYPEYKDSGFEWLGQVPKSWHLDKFRHVFTESSEVNGLSPVGEMLSISGYRGVEIKNYDDENQKRSDEQLETYRVVRAGQLAVNTMWLNYAGLGVSTLEGHVSPAYRAYWIRQDMDHRYVHHLMRSSVYVDGYTACLTGIRPNSLQMSRPTLMTFPVLVPPIKEQQAVANYLDRETAEIDAFIADQEELIYLLGERRTATVSTKTFPYSPKSRNPSAFPLVRIGQAFSESDERVESASPEDLLSVSIHSGVLPWKDLHDKEPRSETLHNYKIVKPGDIVLNRMRAFQGGLGEAKTPGVVSPDYMVMHIRKSADSKYLAYLMKSQQFVAEMSSRLRGIGSEEQGTVRTPRINPRDLSNIRVPLPPIEEQRQIVADLDRETADIDAAIADAREAIALSKERRAAVISAAVTGKIDVRGLAAPAATEMECDLIVLGS